MLAFRRVDVIIAHPGVAGENALLLVVWEFARQDSALGQATFRVERSESQQFSAGEFVELVRNVPSTTGVLVYEFDDITANLSNFYRQYWYRVVATTGGGEIVSEPRTWQTMPRTHELAIIERHDFVLKYLQGKPSFAFIERTTESVRCGACFDLTTQRSTDSRCTLCLGTGRQRPYFEPIPLWIDYNPDEKLVSISNFGEMQPKQKDCWFSAFPQIKPRDVLYEVLSSSLWRVVSVHPIQPQGTTIQHLCRLSAIDPESVEYERMPQRIAPDALRALVQEWERIKEERLF